MTSFGGGFSRRTALGLIGGSLAVGWLRGTPTLAQPQPSGRGAGFSHEDVIAQARRLAASAFEDRKPNLPPELRELDYDRYRAIQFKRNAALWQDSGSDFRLHLFHAGFIHDRPVDIRVVSDGTAIPIPFSTAMFQYGKSPEPKGLSVSTGFAGFTVTTGLNRPDKQDELVSFLGASYFRFLGRGQVYGLSARSLAIGVGGDTPEEFPFFRALWLEKPTGGSVAVTVHALLDSPSVAGALRYVFEPGKETTALVEATLIPRQDMARVGLAPLTSMFLVGEGDPDKRIDFRPEIHDSDGLMLHTGAGEWLWRPLTNPDLLSVSQFIDRTPRGFGLMQRDRLFANYQDTEAQYHARPGYWVEPAGDWGPGRVELVEIPTDHEAMDNIVAYWTPEGGLKAGREVRLSYRIRSLSETRGLHPLGQTRNSFGPIEADAAGAMANQTRFLIDFDGGDIPYHLQAPDRIEVVATTTAGRIVGTTLTPNAATQSVRAFVDLAIPAGERGDLRVYLKAGPRTLTETWTRPVGTSRLPVAAREPAVE